MRPLDPATESAREAVFVAICRQLKSWLGFFSGDESLSATVAQRVALAHSPDELRKPLGEFSSRLEAGEFARIESWSVEQRRAILAELQSMGHLELRVESLARANPRPGGEPFLHPIPRT